MTQGVTRRVVFQSTLAAAGLASGEMATHADFFKRSCDSALACWSCSTPCMATATWAKRSRAANATNPWQNCASDGRTF